MPVQQSVSLLGHMASLVRQGLSGQPFTSLLVGGAHSTVPLFAHTVTTDESDGCRHSALRFAL